MIPINDSRLNLRALGIPGRNVQNQFLHRLFDRENNRVHATNNTHSIGVTEYCVHYACGYPSA